MAVNTVNVFVSHKDHDKSLAIEVKRLLLEHARRDSMNVFVSSDAEGIYGAQWFQRIHVELGKANSLVLLYTDPRRNWDWCFYEAGYFAGRFGDVAKVQNLFVVHPVRVPRPAPLRQWNTVEADTKKIEDVLRTLYACKRFKSGTCFTGNASQRTALANLFAKMIAVYEPEPFLPALKYFITLESELQGGPPYPISVHINPELADRLNIPRDPGNPGDVTYPIEQFAAMPSVAQAHIDGFMLAGLMGELLTNKSIGAAPLPPCILDGKGYRPLIVDDMMLTASKARVKLGFQRIAPNVDAQSAFALEVLAEIINRCARFRATVVDTYARRIDPEKGGQPAPGVASELAQPLLRDVENHVSEAHAAGLQNESDVVAVFGEPVRARVRQLGAQWQAGLVELRAVAREPSSSEAALRAAFRMVRSANYGYMTTAAAELNGLLKQIPPPPDDPDSPPAGVPVPRSPAPPQPPSLLRRLFGL